MVIGGRLHYVLREVKVNLTGIRELNVMVWVGKKNTNQRRLNCQRGAWNVCGRVFASVI